MNLTLVVATVRRRGRLAHLPPQRPASATGSLTILGARGTSRPAEPPRRALASEKGVHSWANGSHGRSAPRPLLRGNDDSSSNRSLLQVTDSCGDLAERKRRGDDRRKLARFEERLQHGDGVLLAGCPAIEARQVTIESCACDKAKKAGTLARKSWVKSMT